MHRPAAFSKKAFSRQVSSIVDVKALRLCAKDRLIVFARLIDSSVNTEYSIRGQVKIIIKVWTRQTHALQWAYVIIVTASGKMHWLITRVWAQEFFARPSHSFRHVTQWLTGHSTEKFESRTDGWKLTSSYSKDSLLTSLRGGANRPTGC